MKILLLAPHPFYQDRGTPIAVDLLLATLAEQGHTVDVVTYHEGIDRSYGDAVRIHRIPPPPGCRNIRPGFSLKKVVCDLYLYRVAKKLLKQQRYDVIHAVEEAAFIARHFKKRFGVPYIFDMDSSMPVQIADAMPVMKPVLPVMRYFEGRAVRDAAAITAVCDALADIARSYNAPNIFLLRDVPLLDADNTPNASEGFREDIEPDGVTLLYVGNLEAYQGIDLLLNSIAQLGNDISATWVIVGGIPKHITRYRMLADELGIGARVHLLGPRPIHDLGALMQDADILLSPRTKGQNTPMKIYSYMASGKPIVATDLPTHTQVLSPETAQLAAPNASAFAAAMKTLIDDPALRQRLGAAARERVLTDYSLPVFKRTVKALYDSIPEAV